MCGWKQGNSRPKSDKALEIPVSLVPHPCGVASPRRKLAIPRENPRRRPARRAAAGDEGTAAELRRHVEAGDRSPVSAPPPPTPRSALLLRHVDASDRRPRIYPATAGSSSSCALAKALRRQRPEPLYLPRHHRLFLVLRLISTRSQLSPKSISFLNCRQIVEEHRIVGEGEQVQLRELSTDC